MINKKSKKIAIILSLIIICSVVGTNPIPGYTADVINQNGTISNEIITDDSLLVRPFIQNEAYDLDGVQEPFSSLLNIPNNTIEQSLQERGLSAAPIPELKDAENPLVIKPGEYNASIPEVIKVSTSNYCNLDSELYGHAPNLEQVKENVFNSRKSFEEWLKKPGNASIIGKLKGLKVNQDGSFQTDKVTSEDTSVINTIPIQEASDLQNEPQPIDKVSSEDTSVINTTPIQEGTEQQNELQSSDKREVQDTSLSTEEDTDQQNNKEKESDAAGGQKGNSAEDNSQSAGQPKLQAKSVMASTSNLTNNSEWYNTLVGPSATNNVKQQQYSITKDMNESVSPKTGDLILQYNDIHLPGRNGLDLDITRLYQSNQALSGDRYSDKANYGWTDYSTYYLDRYALGTGWSFNFPSVQVAMEGTTKELYYHDGQGAVYHVKFNTSDPNSTNLDNYDYKDIKFTRDTSYKNPQNAASAYSLIKADQTKQYFAEDGRLMAIADRFGNKISFDYTEKPVTNRAPNYDFNYPEDYQVWSKDGGCFIYDQSFGKDDQSSLKLNYLNYSAVSYSRLIPVFPNTRYYLSGYIYSNPNLSSQLTWTEYGDNGTCIYIGETLPCSTNNWISVSKEFTTSQYTRYISITWANTGSGNAWLDKVRFDRACPLISQITDSIGRKVNFIYEDQLYNDSTSSGGSITIQVIDPSARTYTQTYTKSKVNWECTLIYPDKHLKEKRMYPTLLGYWDGERTSSYTYQPETDRFSYTSSKPEIGYPCTCLQMDLTQVNLKELQTIQYTYGKTIKRLGKDGYYELYRITDRSEKPIGSNEIQYHQKYTYSATLDDNDSYYNENNDKCYYDNETVYPAKSSQLSEIKFTTMMQQDNDLVTKTTSFNGVDYRFEKDCFLGEKEITTYEGYDTAFPKLPVRIHMDRINRGNHIPLYLNLAYNNPWGYKSYETKPMMLEDSASAAYADLVATTYTYDQNFKLPLTTSRKMSDSQTQSESNGYDNLGRLVVKSNANNETTHYTYDDATYQGNPTKITEYSTEGPTRTTYMAYADNFGLKPTSITQYYIEDGTTKSTNSSFTYDYLWGNVSSKTDESGTTSYEYDSQGRIKKITYPQSTGKDGNYVLQDNYAYNYASLNGINVLRVYHSKTRTGNVDVAQSYSFYDAHGNLLLDLRYDKDQDSDNDPDNLNQNSWLVRSNVLNNYGQLVSSRDPMTHTTSYQYDEWDRLRNITDSHQNQYIYEYDSFYNTKTSYFVPHNGVRENDYVETYDIWDRLISRKGYPNGWSQAGSIEEKYEYDLVDNLTKKTDARNYITQYQYDQLNRLTKVTDALNQVVDYSYNRLGGLKNQIQYQGSQPFTTTNSYDERGLRISSQQPGGETTSTRYNGSGLVSKVTDPNGKVTSFVYYPDGQPMSITSNAKSITKYYSPYGIERYAATGLSENLDYDYYYTGLVKKRTAQDTNGVSFEYDYDGNRTKQTDPFGFIQSYHYDDLDRNDRITVDTSGKVFSFEYYEDGMIKAVNYPNQFKAEYTYDNLNRLQSLVNTNPNGTTTSYSYTYDNNGNIISANNNGNISTYEYDALNRLTRITRQPSPTQSAMQISYTYDSRGNRIQSSSNLDLTTTIMGHFAYNDWDQLKSFGNQYTYEYDPEGLRVKKTGPEGLTRYYYDDNGRVIAERATDTNNTSTISQIVWGKQALARIIGGDYFYYVYNGHGDVVHVISENGTVMDGYTYDEWGNYTLNQAELIKNPLKYAGEYYDNESGLYYLRARYYDPSIGRFISKDSYEGMITNPLSLNLYTYCFNIPTKYVDRSGNNPIIAGAVIGISKGIDYGWTAYDLYDAKCTIDNPNASFNEKFLAGTTIITAPTFEVIEPDDELPIGLPADDIARRKLLSELTGVLSTNGLEGAYKVLKDTFGTKGSKILTKIGDAIGAEIEMHHLLPQAEEFADFFARAGLKTDDYILPLEKARHRLKSGKGVHAGKENWNKVWKDFMKANPDANAAEILDQMNKMRKEFDI